MKRPCRSLCFWSSLSLPFTSVFAGLLAILMSLAICQPTSAQDTSRLTRKIDQFVEAEDYASAAKLAKQVIEIRQNALGARHQETIDAKHVYAYYLIMDDQFASARPFAEQAYQSRKETLGLSNRRTLNSMENLIRVYDEIREWPKAAELQEQYLAIRKQQIGEFNQEIGTEINFLGQLYNQQRKFTEARDRYSLALIIFQRVNGDQDQWTAIAHNNLGLALYELGEYPQALSHVEFALAFFEKHLGHDHPYTASTSDSVGFLLDLQGDTEAALPYYKKALDIRRRAFGDDHLSTAYSYNHLGLVLDDRHEYEDAEQYYRKALKIFRSELGNDDPLTAQVINNLAGCVHDQDRFEEAQSLVLEALEIYQQVYADDNIDIATTQAKLGSFAYNERDYEKAKQYYEPAFATSQRQLGISHPGSIRYQEKLASIAAATGDWAAALAQADATFRNIDLHIRHILVGQTSSEQLSYLKLRMADWERGYSYALARSDDPNAIEKTATWLINSKGIAQETLASREVLTRINSTPQLAQITSQLMDTRQQLARLVIAAPAPGEETAHQEEIANLKQTEKNLSRQLIREMGPISLEDSWVELDDLRAKIPPGEVFVNFARFTPFQFQPEPGEKYWKPARYVAWIIPPQGEGKIQVVDLGLADDLDQKVASARDHLKQAATASSPLFQDGEESAEKAYRETFTPLVEDLWKPLAQHLSSDVKKLILCPDGALWLLPWAAIPHAEDKYLVEDYSIRYLISGRELVAPQVKSATNPPLLFADPDFDLPPQQLWQTLRSIFRDLPLRPDTTRSLVSHTSLGKVSSLPGTRLEAIAIAPSVQQITSTEPIKYLGKYALEGVAKRVKRPRYLVMSTHGFFLPDQQIDADEENTRQVDNRSAIPLSTDGQPLENPLLRCGLLLAGCNNPTSSGDDGVLTGLEIVGIDLRGTDLVVLSACETGIGKLQTGEGVAGLRQSFQIAGAQGIVSTLWQIPDRDSALIMTDFFQTLADGTDKAEALRTAQLKRIQSRRERYAGAHPFFWAAWTLTGM